jgi:ATP-dependent helicase/nuclease subunit A
VTPTMVAADQDIRDRLRTELGTTFFVEAGAGTGKTKELVERIASLVASGVPMERIAAMTFTDAAAAELRGRVRLQLEQAGADESLPQDARARCSRGALDIDLAAIQTIHSFAGGLLRLFPLEARLPPGFTVWNELEQDIAFKERFRRWLYDEVPGHPSRERAVALAFGLGLSATQLENLAARLQDHYDLLDAAASWRPGPLPDALEAAHEIGGQLRRLMAFLEFAHNPDGDPLAAEVRAAQPAADRLSESRTEEEALIALKRFRDVNVSSSRGRQTDWDNTGFGNPVALIKAAIKGANDHADEVLLAHRAGVLGEVMAHLRDLTLTFANERRAQGVATFHDLLVWARDLLRDHADVRRRAHDKFERVLIDEFQDTDPLQVEIAWFLTSDPKLAHETDWRNLRPEPGRLFVVGDPKQSIYRFRRADIGIYEDVRAALGFGSQVVALTQNFRSVGPLLDWVNHHLGSEMKARPGVQPEYRKLHPRPEAAHGEGVPRRGAYRLGGLVEGKAGERWRAEANAVAKLARQIVDEGWLVTRGNDLEPVKARYQDICVLLPTRTNLRRLARAFEQQDVPYRMESGSLVLNTAEVRDLLSCLRAIEDPSDQVALVAALRSPAYACSDVDLLAWAESGGRFDYEQPGSPMDGSDDQRAALVPGAARVGAALANLREFHKLRHRRSSAATIEAFIRDRLLAVQAFGQPRPREAWRRLRYVVAQARRLAASGQPSLRAAADWLEGLQQESFYDAESAVPEADEDAVRFMTVHGSKGLEFPIVILTGLGAVRMPARGLTIASDWRERRLEIHLNSMFATAGYDQTHEDELDQAEQIRLLYVATTRARDHLVLSLFHTARELESNARKILNGLQEVPHLCHALQLGRLPTPEPTEPAIVPEPVSPNAQRAAEEAWLASRDLLTARLGAQRRFTATSLAHAEIPDIAEPELALGADADTAGTEPGTPLEPVRWLRAGRAATALGLAVHSVLQTIDLASLADLEAFVRAAAAEYGISGREEEIAILVRAAVSSSAVQTAISGRFWREVPVGISYEGTLLEGCIDLLYEHSDGTLGVVDYKTDRITAGQIDERMNGYRLQGGVYAFAVQHVVRKDVSSVEFVFAALGRTERLADVNAITHEIAALLADMQPVQGNA